MFNPEDVIAACKRLTDAHDIQVDELEILTDGSENNPVPANSSKSIQSAMYSKNSSSSLQQNRSSALFAPKLFPCEIFTIVCGH